MSLFPAYAIEKETEINDQPCSESSAIDAPCSELTAMEATCSVSSATEAQLLASDNDEEREAGATETGAALEQNLDYYVDRKFDVGNLRVSTLYYPGRPQYKTAGLPGGRMAGGVGGARDERIGPRRYFNAPPPAPDALGAHEMAQRTVAFRTMLERHPTDEALWLRFIEFQERFRDSDAALAAAIEATERLRGSRRVRAALHRAREMALPAHVRRDLLRQELAQRAAAAGAGGDDGDAGAELTELWLRALADCSLAELDAAAAAALAAMRAQPAAYPHVLYVYGGQLRAAGLWERLVLLLELVLSMNFPPATGFPPTTTPERLREQERQLQTFEDKVSSSGLPRCTQWVRVERCRAAQHWRAPPAAASPGAASPGAASSGAASAADPQRTPHPADVAELLRPCAGPAAALLLVQVLRLAKVPLLPLSEYALSASNAANDARGDWREADGAEALLAVLRAARRLPRAHAARPRPVACALLMTMFLDPPHYFTDNAGYLTWVSALWDAACEWLAGEQRVALLCWRLRWMHALLLLLDPLTEIGKRESRRMRGEARAALKRFAGTSALPYVHFARVEHAAAELPAARRTALHALRAAMRDPGAPLHQRLYIARVAGEVCDDVLGMWAIACAALQEPLPPDELLLGPPPADLLHRALQRCEERCAALEAADDELQPHQLHVLDAALPAPAEWAAARAWMAPPARRAQLLQALRTAPLAHGAARLRYREQSACALVLAAAREHRQAQCARALAPLFPHNALLALACSGAPLWAWERDQTMEERLRALTSGLITHRAALAHVTPLLLLAADAKWSPAAAARVSSACSRATRAGAGGPLLHALRVESEARTQGRPAAAVYGALDRYPQHKWLAVRGAAWLPAQCAALSDLLLERGLRAHTLLDEIAPPQAV